MCGGAAAHHHGSYGYDGHEPVSGGEKSFFGGAGFDLLVCAGIFNDIGVFVFESKQENRQGTNADQILQANSACAVSVRDTLCLAGADCP